MDVEDDSVAISERVTVVKNVINQANISGTDPDRDLRVTSVELTLNAIAVVTAGGGIDFRLPVIGMKLKAGASITRRDTHTIDISLAPPDLVRQYEIRDREIETVLLNAIEAIRSTMTLAAQGDDPLLLASSSVELSFAITRDGSITLGVNGELTNEVTQR